ncbi:MAG: polyprenyl synthetase family protein [Gammaproteobacteria bacterium]|nr:polyprenyl synthetase family protein [Gammaproteobacteria bacterium]
MQHTNFSQNRIERINKRLDEILPAVDENPQHLHRAMRYATQLGGKRIRPLLVYATGDGLNAPLTQLDLAACAVELIHAYSLVHDDLPAMDNDDMRRGQPSCHKAFDEATAILVGDALQSLAFEILSESNGPHQLKMIQVLAKASGSRGMVGGQSLDLIAINKTLSHDEIKNIHHLKTGALIVASIQLGALSSPECDPSLFNQLSEFAEHLGLAYQIQDDIFDYREENTETNQPCFVSSLGLEKAHHLLKDLNEIIHSHLSSLIPSMPELEAIFLTITNRKN